MSRERFWRHGQLKEFLCNPANIGIVHTFPTDAVPSMRVMASIYGIRVSAKPTGSKDTRTVTLKPMPA